jgi:branched-chain amino acid transport system substrate-binding protein
MRLFSKLVTSAAVMAFVFTMSSAHNAEAAKLAGRNVKIGCMVPLTGKGAEWGQAAKTSMEIAVKEINAKGGIGGVPVDLICYDTQTLESEGLKSVSRLVERDKVLAISGPCYSSVYETIAPQLDSQLKTVIDSYCSSKPGLSAMSKWAFRNTLTSDKQLKPVVAAWVKEYKPKKVVVIYDAQDAVSRAEGAKILPVLLKADGVDVVGELTYRTNDTDYSAQITKAKSLGVDGIALGSSYQNAGAIVKEARKQGLNVPFVAGAATSTPGFIDIAGKAAEGTYLSTAAWIDDPRPAAAAYLKKYKAASGGKSPNYGGPRSYDNIYLFKHCIEATGATNKPADLASDREKIRECMAKTKNFPGAAGELTFDEHGDGTGITAILKVENGKYVNILK